MEENSAKTVKRFAGREAIEKERRRGKGTLLPAGNKTTTLLLTS